MAKIIRRIIGVPCVMIGIAFLIVMLMIPIVFDGSPGVTWEDLNWPAVLLLMALQLLSMTTGVVLLRWEHYQQKWQEHRTEREAEQRYSIKAEEQAEHNRRRKAKEWEKLQRAKESYQREQMAKQKKQEKLIEASRRQEKEQQKLLEIPSFPGSQRVTLYLNRHAGVANYIWCILYLGMAVSSLLVVPLIVEQYKERELLLVTLGITITFLIGFVGSIFSWSNCKSVSVEAYALTNEGILYRLSFAPMESQKRAITKLGAAIEDYKYIWEESELRDKQRAYIRSDVAPAMVEKVINENASFPLRGQVIRLNSPSFIRRGISGARIRYWNETAERWETVKLLSSNDGYDLICQTIQKKMDRHEANISY